MLRAFAALLFLALVASSPLLCAQDRENYEQLRSDLEKLSQRVASGADREAHLQGRVHQLERDLESQRLDSSRALEELTLNRESSELETRINDLSGNINSAHALRSDEDSPVELGGYFDIEFRDDQSQDNTTFDQHRLILQLNANIYRNAITFKMELEIEGGGADASFLSNNEIVLEYAEIHFHIADAFNFKAGALLVPFGKFNRLHDAPLRDLTDRPLVTRRITPTTWTDAGVGIYGAFEITESLSIDYDVVIINGLDDDFSSTPGGGFRGARNSFRRDNNDNKMIIGRLGFTPDIGFLDYANVGWSLGFGQYDDDDDQEVTLFGFDWTLKKGPFEFIGEYAQLNLERGLEETLGGVPGGADGFYAQVNFHFFPESWVGANDFFTEESTFTLVFRFGTIDTDDSARAIDRAARGDSYRDDLIRYTIGLNFRPVESTVIKFEYQFFDTKGGVDSANNDRFVISIASFF